MTRHPDRKGWSVLLALIGLLALAIAGVTQLGRPDPGFVALTLDGAGTGPDRTVHLELAVENETDAATQGTLTVSGSGAAGPATLWSGEVKGSDRASIVQLELPNACGQRLTITFQFDGAARLLDVAMPCPTPAANPSAAPSSAVGVAPPSSPSAARSAP